MKLNLRSSVLFLCCFVFTLLPLAARSQQLIDWVPIANQWPGYMAVNPVTNMIYVSEIDTTTLNVVNGATDALTTVTLPDYPNIMAVNSVTNKIYVGMGGAVAVVDGATNKVTNLNINAFVASLAVNPVTDETYAVDNYDGLIWVINGANQVTSIPDSDGPFQVVLDSGTNLIFVSNNDGTVTVINGTNNKLLTKLPVSGGLAVNTVTQTLYVLGQALLYAINESTLSVTTTVQLPEGSDFLLVDSATNKIFTIGVTSSGYPILSIDANSNYEIKTLTTLETTPFDMILDTTTDQLYMTFIDYGVMADVDATSGAIKFVNVGLLPTYLAANETTDRIYVGNRFDESVAVMSGSPYPLQFVPVTPCRLIDTRQTGGIIYGGQSRSFDVPQLGGCNIPTSAKAYSLNVTAIPPINGTLGYLTIWPTGENQPVVSTLNSPDGRTKANAAIVPFGQAGAVSVYVSNSSNVILDIDGYFTAPTQGGLQFYPLSPCRLVDTRGSDGPLGGPRLPAQKSRDFPLRDSNCIPSGLSIQAYSLNFTVVPNPVGQALNYLTVWPTGQTQPYVSTLNNPTATVVANAALVPEGTNGDIEVYAYNTTDLLIDINGYFAPPGSGGQSMYPLDPCRVLDTRQNGPPFQNELTVNVVGSACEPPSGASAYILNATVVPPGPMPYLTLWADGQKQPVVSTLNAYDGAITSNMAIVPTDNGSIDAYAAGLTQLLLDISGYFAP